MPKTPFKIKPVKSINMFLTATALSMGLGLGQPAFASEPFIAEIKMFGGNFAPRGYALCDGQLLPISQNAALFSILGTTYGGDGRTTFGLPDLRGRTAVHPGSGPGLSQIRLGQKGGAETHTLTVAQMPAHNHAATLHATSTRGLSPVPTGKILATKPRTNIYSHVAPDVAMSTGAVTTADTGGSQSFSIRDPYLAINHIIALVGLFPSRS